MMLKQFQKSSSQIRFVIGGISGVLLSLSGGCSNRALNQPRGGSAAPVAPSPVAIAPEPPANQPAPSAPSAAIGGGVVPAAPQASDPNLGQNTYAAALDRAASAATISQSAQSQDDWKLVTSELSDAIALLRAVPKNSPYKALTRSKLTEYQRQLNYAKRQVVRYGGQVSPEIATAPVIVPARPTTATGMPRTSNNPTRSASMPQTAATTTSANAGSTNGTVPSFFQARIKRRAGGTPVIDVTFNGNQTFEMIVDTGASGTLITQKMAQVLGVVPFSEVTVDTASQKGVKIPIGFVNSIEVDGAVIRDVPVAIAGPDIDLGLLGHDFFGDYDITIRRDVVEFRVRS